MNTLPVLAAIVIALGWPQTVLAPEEVEQLVLPAKAQLAGGQEVQAQEVIPPLKGVSPVAVEVQARAAGDENVPRGSARVVQQLGRLGAGATEESCGPLPPDHELNVRRTVARHHDFTDRRWTSSRIHALGLEHTGSRWTSNELNQRLGRRRIRAHGPDADRENEHHTEVSR